MVDVGAWGQAGEVGGAVGVGEVGQAQSVSGDVDAAAADRIGGRVRAVSAVPPERLRRCRGRWRAHRVAAPQGPCRFGLIGDTTPWRVQPLPDLWPTTHAHGQLSLNVALLHFLERVPERDLARTRRWIADEERREGERQRGLQARPSAHENGDRRRPGWGTD